MNTLNQSTLRISTWPHPRGEHICEAYLACDSYFTSYDSCLYYLGRRCCIGIQAVYSKIHIIIIWAIQFVQYVKPFYAKRVASTKGRRQWRLFCSASREGLVQETPVRVLLLTEQCTEPFGSLGESYTLAKSLLRAGVWELWNKSWQGRLSWPDE